MQLLRRFVLWMYVNVLPGIIVSIGLLFLLAIAGEIYLRSTTSFNRINWPTRFDRRFGWNFVPDQIVSLTNYVDFWATAKVNSLGFLDREPPAGKAPGICRVAFIGDSFVEAAQLPVNQKIQVVFEDMANRQITDGRRFDTVAFGFSGTGQLNQLPFYDVFARPLKPNVVVLVFVSNDFANNSSVLESVRNGWHPLHPPRLFFERNHATGACEEISIDPAWENYVFPRLQGEQAQQSLIVRLLVRESFLYNWLITNCLASAPALKDWLSGNPLPLSKVYRYRMEQIEKIDKYAGVFEGWDPDEINMDNIIASETLPRLFEDAVLLTGHALDEYKERSQRDGFQLIVLAASNVATLHDAKGRTLQRLKQLVSDRGIPLVDQNAYLISKQYNSRDVSFHRDGHWTAQGHRWAAEALVEYFQEHPEICR